MHRIGCRIPRTVVVIALALTVAACGGRLRPDDGEGISAVPGDPAATVTAAPASDLTPAPTAAPASEPAPTLVLPDLSGIDAYLVDIDGALGADGGAGGQEGSDR